MSEQYLIDNSAWARLWSSALPEARRADIADAITDRRMHVCLPFLLEAGYSARGVADYGDLMRTLRSLPYAPLGEDAEERALELQADLVASGHHRLPPVDLLIAAIAERNGLTVLHCDKDFDLIRERTSATLSAEWLAPPTTFS